MITLRIIVFVVGLVGFQTSGFCAFVSDFETDQSVVEELIFKPFDLEGVLLTRLDFRKGKSDRSRVVSGFSKAESWGTWTVGKRAEVTFTLPVGEHFEFYFIRIKAMGYVAPPKLTKQFVTVLVDGVSLGRIHFKNKHFEILDLPVLEGIFSPHRHISLEFEIDKPTKPADLGENPDVRELGMMVDWIEVHGFNLEGL